MAADGSFDLEPFRAAFAAAPVALVIASRDGRVLFANAEGERYREVVSADLCSRITRRERIELRDLVIDASLIPESDAVVLAITPREQPAPEWNPIRRRGALDLVETLARSGRSGLLLFVSGDRQKSVQLEEGHIASIASNDPAESLAERLVTGGAISEAQRSRAVDLAGATNVAIGRALVIIGALEEEDVTRAVHEKIDHELMELDTWTDGRWTFVARQPPGEEPVHVALPLDELRQFANPEFISSRLGNRYHRASCTAMARVHAADREFFASAALAEERGLEPCRVCVR